MDWKKAKSEAIAKETENTGTGNPYRHIDDNGRKYFTADIIFLIVFTTIGFVLGLVLFAVGIWYIVDKNLVTTYLRVLLANHMMSTLALDLTFANPIIWGLFSCVPFGLCMFAVFTKKARSAKKSMLALMIVLIVILVFELPTTFVPIVMLKSLDTPNTVRAGLHVSMNTEYQGLPDGYLAKDTVSLAWDDFMIWQDCCGVDGSDDFLINLSKYAAKWMKAKRSYTIQNGTVYPPSSVRLTTACCKLSSKVIRRIKDWWNIQNYLVDNGCPVFATNYNKPGCNTKLLAGLQEYTEGTFVGLLLLCLLQLVTVIIANMTLFCPASCHAICQRDVKPKSKPIEHNTRTTQEYDGRTMNPPLHYRPPNQVKPMYGENTPHLQEPEGPAGMPYQWKQTTYSNEMSGVFLYSTPDARGHRRF